MCDLYAYDVILYIRCGEHWSCHLTKHKTMQPCWRYTFCDQRVSQIVEIWNILCQDLFPDRSRLTALWRYINFVLVLLVLLV